MGLGARLGWCDSLQQLGADKHKHIMYQFESHRHHKVLQEGLKEDFNQPLLGVILVRGIPFTSLFLLLWLLLLLEEKMKK